MPEGDPHSILEEAVREVCGGRLPGDLPRRWERFSDVAIMPRGSFEGDGWPSGEPLWGAVAGALGAKRLARLGEVSGDFR